MTNPSAQMNVTLELQQIEKNIREYENAKVAHQTRLDEHRKQYVQIEQEYRALGVNPQNIHQELTVLAQNIKEEIMELKALMPANLIAELQKELNSPIEVPVQEVDFGLQFM